MVEVVASSSLVGYSVFVITYKIGDATNPEERPAVIAHIVNNTGAWGRGFVLALDRRWSEPRKNYKAMTERLLGDVQFVGVEPGLVVANMVAQNGLISFKNPKPVVYSAVAEAWTTVVEYASELEATIIAPRIGCGLGGGTWDHIEPIIIEGNYPTVIYDLE